MQCHGTADLWEGETLHLFVSAERLAGDIHWQKGLRCQDCHGGDATTTDLRSAHAVEVGFRKVTSPAEIPAFCGHCHSDPAKMQKYRPDARTDTVDRFWSGAHGKHLKAWSEKQPPAAVPADGQPADAPDAEPAPADVAPPTAAAETGDETAPEDGEKSDEVDPAPTAEPTTEPSSAEPAAEENGTPESPAADGIALTGAQEPAAPESEANTTIAPLAATGDEPAANAPATPAAALPAKHAAANHAAELPVASCVACHPVHQMRAATDPLSSTHPRNLATTCGACHTEALANLRRSVHAKAGEKLESGMGTLLDCGKCHGQDMHQMKATDDVLSPVYLDHQVATCGACHERYLKTYEKSIHGMGLMRSGLLVTAVCSNCHGAHGIYYAADKRSTLHPSNVVKTCGECHHFLADILASSVHGDQAGAGNLSTRPAPGGTRMRKPSCTDCHEGHDPARPDSAEFRASLPNRCGNCHADLADKYRMSLHGELTDFGYVPAAECADCHGAHDIRRLADPQSHLAVGDNRLTTCRKCHTNAVASFATFDPHASYKDVETYPLLYNLYHGTETVIFILVGLFALHMLLWFTRSFFFALRNGRDRPCVAEARAIQFFTKPERVVYVILIISFIGLVVTGVPLKYGTMPWARRVASVVGGFDTTSVFHRSFAILLILACLFHVGRVIVRVFRRRRTGESWRGMLFGPDSPAPSGRDVWDMARMVRWFFGLGPKPKFERWAYWEKCDYWAVYLAMALIAIPGLMLWFPNFFCLFLPGTVLNVAKLLHAETALMAAGFVFMIHVFNTHMRPEKFPLDMSWFTGVVSEEHMIKSRPDFLRRMQAEGKLQSLRTLGPDKPLWRRTFVQAFCLIGVGLCVLAVVVLVSLSK
jgi:cytochrome b subunit of formate dehydrogenase/DNA-directed RNA polymerase subunit M/transcription elongation factor TFIIS